MISSIVFKDIMLIKMENCIFDNDDIDKILSSEKLKSVQRIIIIDGRTPSAFRFDYFNNKINANIDIFANNLGEKLTVYSTFYTNKKCKCTKEPICIQSNYGYVHPIIIKGHVLLIESNSLELPTVTETYQYIFTKYMSKKGGNKDGN